MSICAITSYYNPMGFASRYRNFLTFRQRLKLPLLTVEWSQSGDFQLTRDDSDILISVSGGDLMWQKERLLNLALGALPQSCDVVVWLDCDIFFESDLWIGQLDASLEHAPIVQLFSEVVHLNPSGAEQLLVRESLVATCINSGAGNLAQRVRSDRADDDHRPSREVEETVERLRLGSRPSSGHAWAARRSLLEKHGFYDGCVYGAGDMAIALAALGLHDVFLCSFPLNTHQRSHYEEWAAPFAASTGGQVGLIQSRIHHLFHGPLSSRQYQTRLRWAADSGVDPAEDLTLTEHGVWRWTTDRRSREAWMTGYFERRMEDEN